METTTDAPALEFVPQGRDIWITTCRRFDLYRSADENGAAYWAAYDWDAGTRFRGADRAACEAWCRDRAKGGGA